jgi:GNAT superfamily N-acetyltransferase
MTDQAEIRIEHVKIEDIEQFAREVIAAAQPGQFVPITLQRARAHAQNPLASPEDVSLLVAYQRGEIVGFFGMLPICLKVNASLEKIYWFSTWRVAPHFRGKALGSALMKEALSLDQDFVIVGSGPARKVCQRFGFLERDPLVYYQLDLTGMQRLNPATWVSRLLRKLLRPFKVRVSIENRFTRVVERVLSAALRPMFTAVAWRTLNAQLAGYRFQEVSQVLPETDAQLAARAEVQFWRSSEVVNWMLGYPWVVEPGNSPTEQMDFYFSDVRQRFRNYAVEISTAQGDYMGYVIFLATTVRGRVELKTLDVSLPASVDRSVILPLALSYAQRENAVRIDLPVEACTAWSGSCLGRLLLQRRERTYQCHPCHSDSPLARAWADIRLAYSDGDMPFS